MKTRSAWIEVDLDKLKRNMIRIKKMMEEDAGRTVEPMMIVKANAYGHGIYHVTKAMREVGIKRFGVATFGEAMLVRAASEDADILILGHVPEDIYEEIIRNHIAITCYSYEQARALSACAEKMTAEIGEAPKGYVHIKIDTGMHRLGFQVDDDSVQEIAKISKLKNIKVPAIFTHFATSTMKDKSFVHIQASRFEEMVRMLEDAGIDIPIKHTSNGGIILDNPEHHWDVARVGSTAYGTFMDDDVDKTRFVPEVAFSLKAQIATVNEVKTGEGIGYDLTFMTARASKIATIPIGYADIGIRKMANTAEVLLRGQRAHVVGGICMDQMMIDVTEIDDVAAGDEVTLIGMHGDDEITLDQAGVWAEKDDYEFAVSAMARIPRVYIEDGKVIDTIEQDVIMAQYFVGREQQ